jgi:1-acyl-sn-glycerol-3-phosphate acyltransferase
MTYRPEDPTRERPVGAAVRRVAAALLRLLFRIRMVGTEHVPATGPVLLAGNHTGFLDGPFVMILLDRPTAFLVKSELWDSPFRRVLAFAGQIPVRRGTPDRTALRRALDVLERGGVLGMFPEGTRGEGRLESVQHGIGYIALRAGCPVVPVVCTGTAEALPKGAKLPRFGTRIQITFGAPFQVDVAGNPRARSTVAAAAEQIRLRLLDHLETVAGQPR